MTIGFFKLDSIMSAQELASVMKDITSKRQIYANLQMNFLQNKIPKNKVQ